MYYRRHFILPEDWLKRMQENHMDVILPVPLYVAPSLAENYKSRHAPSDWEYMMECLKERSTLEYEEAKAFFKSRQCRVDVPALCGEKIAGLLSMKDGMGFKVCWDGACRADKIQKFAPRGMDGLVLGTTMLFGKGFGKRIIRIWRT